MTWSPGHRGRSLGSVRALAIAASVSVLALDRWTKHLIERFFNTSTPAHSFGPPSVEVLGNALRLTYVRNRGMVFGLFAQASFPHRELVFLALSLAAIAVLAVYFLRVAPERRSLVLGLALVLGGAAGNLVDRALRGYVVDFVDVSLYLLRWPAFNLADAAIVAGVGLMSVELIRGEPSPPPAG